MSDSNELPGWGFRAHSRGSSRSAGPEIFSPPPNPDGAFRVWRAPGRVRWNTAPKRKRTSDTRCPRTTIHGPETRCIAVRCCAARCGRRPARDTAVRDAGPDDLVTAALRLAETGRGNGAILTAIKAPRNLDAGIRGDAGATIGPPAPKDPAGTCVRPAGRAPAPVYAGVDPLTGKKVRKYAQRTRYTPGGSTLGKGSHAMPSRSASWRCQ